VAALAAKAITFHALPRPKRRATLKPPTGAIGTITGATVFAVQGAILPARKTSPPRQQISPRFQDPFSPRPVAPELTVFRASAAQMFQLCSLRNATPSCFRKGA
jgi:hypothetical protein